MLELDLLSLVLMAQKARGLSLHGAFTTIAYSVQTIEPESSFSVTLN